MPRLNDRPAVYVAAQRWVSAALTQDGSLFADDRSVWFAGAIEDLYQRFVVHEDLSDADFWTKLERQLAGAEPATIQLAAELIYVVRLPLSDVLGSTKRERILQLLARLSPPPAISNDLDAALTRGLFNGRQASVPHNFTGERTGNG